MGILLKSSEALESLGQVRMIVLDKTGTITRGQPAVTDIIVRDQYYDRNELLRLAASVEKNSEHPLGEAIVAEAGNRALELSEPSGFAATAGHGVEAQVDGTLVVVGSPRMLAERGLDIEDYAGEVTRLQVEGKTAVLVALDNRVAGVIAIADTVKEGSIEHWQSNLC